MTRLDEDRAAIDRIDEQLTALFEERFNVVKDVIAYKIENNLPIFNAGREAVIIEKNANRIQDDSIRPYFEQMYRQILVLSKDYQKEILDQHEQNQ